ncbi:MAG: TMEM43 family protein [Eubacteriales bacterium]
MDKRRGCFFGGIVVGIIMIVVFTVVLFNNEGRAVNRKKALENIDNAVEISSAVDGDLIIMSGEAQTDAVITDDVFMVEAPENTIKMKKTVSMYQWVEHSETDDNDNVTYTYKKEWSTSLQDSSGFHTQAGHENPAAMIYSSNRYTANEVKIGEYTLESVFVDKLNKYQPYSNMHVPVKDLKFSLNENKIFISESGTTSITSPGIGDYLIEYEIVQGETITIVGGKTGSTIISYYTKNGNLNEVSYGIKDKAVLKQEKIDENNRLTWIIRIGSIIALMAAFGMLFSPLTTLLGRVPILGSIVTGGAALIGGVLGGAWGIIVIAIGWLYFKPVLAISMIVGVVAIVVLVSRAKKHQQSTL